MADRILLWHQKEGAGRIGPTFYMEGDYSPIGCRIYAEVAPAADMEVGIYDDGKSIFRNRRSVEYDSYGRVSSEVDARTVVLPKGQNSEDDAADFTNEEIAEGSWVHCEIANAQSARNITVQLELEEN